MGVASLSNGSTYVLDCVVVAVDVTGTATGLATRGPEGLNQGNRDVSVRFGAFFFCLSNALLFSFSLSLPEVELAPATAPAMSLLL